MDNSLYYIKLKNYMICSKFLEVSVEHNGEVLGMSCRLDGIKLVITLNPSIENCTIPESCEKYIVNLSNDGVIDTIIDEGTYKLSPLLILNDNFFLLTPKATKMYMVYFNISEDYIDKSVCYEDSDTFYFLVRKVDSTDVNVLTEFLRNSDYIYPLNTIKFCPINTNKSEGELLPHLPNFAMVNPKQNKFIYNSRDFEIIHKNRDEIYITSFHYLDKVMTTLKAKNPDILFLNSPDLLSDENLNIKDNQEVIIYTSEIGDFNNGTYVGHSILDPTYGYVWRHSMRIRFEYSCANLELFNRRRTDMHIDRFITGYAKDHLILNDGSAVGFPIIWDLQQLTDSDLQSILTTTESGAEKYKLTFSCELIIMTFRYIREKSGIIRHIISNVVNVGADKTLEETSEAIENNTIEPDTTVTVSDPDYIIEDIAKDIPPITSIEGFDDLDIFNGKSLT